MPEASNSVRGTRPLIILGYWNTSLIICGRPMQIKKELLYWVDDNDIVQGTLERHEIFERGFNRRVVDIIVYDRTGHILLQQRSAKKKTSPLLWVHAVGGHVDSGESYLEAAVREVEEEIGVTVEPAQLHFIGRIIPSVRGHPEFVQVYGLILDQTNPLTPNPDEVEKLLWADVPSLNAWRNDTPADFGFGFRNLWEIFEAPIISLIGQAKQQ